MPITKVISGGQSGVDRAALDVALHLRGRGLAGLGYALHPKSGCTEPLPERLLPLEVGGWCPLDRRAEDGPIPDRYPVQPCASLDYNVRTFKNVQDSDGTLIICVTMPTGGTAKTIQYTRELRKPYTMLYPNAGAMAAQEHNFQAWCEFNNIKTLNIAGPRESKCPGIYQLAHGLLRLILPLVCNE